MTDKETLNEKILNLRAAVVSAVLRKNKIKHSANILEKIIVNEDNISAYNYFALRKNKTKNLENILEKIIVNKDNVSTYNNISLRKIFIKKIIILSISTLIILIISYVIYKYWPLAFLQEMFYK